MDIDEILNTLSKEDLIALRNLINEKIISFKESTNNIKIRITSSDEVIKYIMNYTPNNERAYNLENREHYTIIDNGWNFYIPLLLSVDKTYSDEIIYLRATSRGVYSYGAVFRPVFVFDD